MANVLIATLGDSPVVVSGMVNVLRDQKGIVVDVVQIIYPDEPTERWIGIGYELLETHFTGQGLDVQPVPLPFADAHTEDHSFEFLRVLNTLMDTHEHQGNTMYFSIAGGRKHISALMSVMTQFYRVHGLYHLHDIEEGNPRKQYTIEFLEKNPDRLNQPASRFKLIELPHESLINGIALRKWLAQKEQGDEPPPIPVSPETESFYGRLFQGRELSTTQLDLWLTKIACDQYDKKYKSSLQEIERYFEDMTDPTWLSKPDSGIHNHADDSHIEHTQEGSGKRLIHYACKKGGTGVRPFYYTQPHPIRAYPNERVERVVITRFSEKTKNNVLDVELTEWVKYNPLDIEPFCRAVDLPGRRMEQQGRPVVLIAPLGESPMVVTQAYTLLKSPGHTRPPTEIDVIYIVYPNGHEPARNGARLLQNVCQKQKIDLHSCPLAMEDLDSTEAATVFINGLQEAIGQARQQHPDAGIALLISGGRKGMSALAFYVAQVEGISRVYHTTISDPERESTIENLTKYDALKSKPTAEQAELLFLDKFDPSDFTLITVPVIALSAK